MFIYVMDADSKEKLLNLGYKLVKEHEAGKMWVFENKKETVFENIGVPCVVSDTLTF